MFLFLLLATSCIISSVMKISKPSTGDFSSSRSFCTLQYVLVFSSATNSSFFLCMSLPGEFLVCTVIGVRFIFLVLNFQVLVVCFITTFIKSFEQLLSWKLLVFFITFFTFRFTLQHGRDKRFEITNFETAISYGINHTKFVYCRQETFKMGVHTTKSTLPINSR